jgi:Mg2+/Co2+ transporter CorB
MNGAGAGVLPVDVWLAIATILLCVALSAFFSASETALTAASRARMHALEKNGDRRAALVNRLLASRARLIGTTLLGQTLPVVGSRRY